MTTGAFAEARSRRYGALRIGFYLSPTTVTRTSPATEHVTAIHWLGGSAEICPPDLMLGGAAWTACGRVGLHRTASEAEGKDTLRRSEIVWATLEIPVRLHARLTRHIFFELEGAPVLALKEPPLVLYPLEFTEFRPAWLGFAAASSVGVSFP